MAIYDDTVKKYKQYLKDAQIEALMEKSRQYNRENAGNRADAVSQARSNYDTAYRGLQNMGLAGAKETELTGEVPRLKTNIAGQFDRVNAQLYNREQQAVEALGGQYAAQTKAQQAAAAAARAAAASQAEAEEAAKRSAVGGLVTGAVSAALAGQTKPNANTATLIPSKGQRIGMETAAKARGTGGMVTGATAAAIAQQEFEQKKALAAMQALGIRRSKFASSPTQKTAAQTTVNALQSSQAAQQEYLSAMEMLRRAQAGAQKDPRAGSGVAYYADKVGEILSNATIPTEQRVQMAMEYLQADVDEKTSPLADRKAKEIIARAYGLKVPKSDETFDALDKARRSKTGGLGYGVGATYDKDAEIAFRQEQSNRAEYNYYMPAIANKIRYAGKTGKVNDKENDYVYSVINGKITEEDFKKLYGRSDPGTKNRYLLLDEEEKNAYNYLYEKKGLKAANNYADSLMPLLEMRGAEADKAAWEEYTKEHPVAANIHSVGLSAAEIAPAISRIGIGAYNEISGTKNPAYVDTNSTLYSGTNRRTTIRTKTSGMILGDNPTGWQKAMNFAYNTGMSWVDSATMLPFAYAGLPWVSDLVFFSSASNDAYKDAISRGANQADAILAGAASGIAEALFEHASLDKVVKMSTSGKGKFIMNALKQAGIEASEEACTSVANLITDKLFLGELSNNELDRKNYIQEYMATGMSREEAEKKANIQVFTDTIKDIGTDALAGFLSGLGFGLFGAATNAYTQKQIGKEVKQNSEVLDNDYRLAELLGGETADLARKYDQRSITEMEAGDLHTAIVSKLQEQAEVSEKNAETVAAVLDGREISADQAADMLQSSKDFLQEAGYDTSSADALAASYNQRVEEVATAQKEAFDNRARDYNIKRAEEVYTDKEALRNVPLTLPTGVSPVQFADAERSNFKSRTTIQSDGVELQLSLMDMDGRFTNEQKLERARKAMTAQAQRKLDMIGKISKALGMDVVVHDYMRGSNGYFGEDGKIHFVLSGHMSVARVAAHELTHQMQSVASEKYTVVRDQLIEDVGQDRFDRLLKRKAAQYGYNMESEQGRLACDEEVIAELCEGMLSDKDRLERFAERHTDTALTLKDRLTKILNAIHATLKDTFGQNQNRISDMITDEKTADKWLDGLDEVLKKVQEKQQTKEFSDAGTKFSIREEAPPVKTGIAYKVFFVKDGKLYPPMVANPGGADTPIGVWLNADVGAAAPDSKTGRQQVKAGGKGTQGGSGSLAFRPGWHLGDIPRASQFDRLNQATGKKELFPENFVWAECEYAKDVDYQKEAMSYGYTENGKYRHSYAGLPRIPKDGYYRYRTNPNPETVPWVITGAMKVNRLLSDAEVNSILEKNGVAPVHRQGGDVSLEDLGFANVQAQQNVAKFALEIVDGKKIAWVENSGLSRKDLQNYKKVAEYIGEHIGEAYTIIESGSKVYIGEDLPGEYTQSEYTRRLLAKNRAALFAKKKAVGVFGDMIEIATNRRWEKTKHTHNKDAKYGMYRYDTCFAFPVKNNAGKVVDVKAYDAELLIRNASNGKKYLYDIVNIKENTDYQPELQQRKSRKGGAMLPADNGVSSGTMTQNGESVKGKFSLDEAYRKAVSSGNVQERRNTLAGQNAQTAEDGKVSNSLEDYKKPITEQDVEVLRSIGRKSVNEFTGADLQKAGKWAYKFYQELGTKSPFFRAWFGDWRANDTSTVKAAQIQTLDISNAIMERGTFTVDDTGWTVYAGTVLQGETKHYARGERISEKALSSIKEILSNAILLDTEVSSKSSNKKSKWTAFMHKLYTPITYDGRNYIAKIAIEEFYNEGTQRIQRRAYQLQSIKIEPVGGSYVENSTTTPRSDTSSIRNVSDLYALVKQYDKDFTAAHEVHPALLNADGTPKKWYHSTNADFTTFKQGSGVLGDGIYFSDYAQRLYGKNTKEVYLNVENPINLRALPNGARNVNSSGIETSVISNFFEKFPQYDAIVDSRHGEIVVKSPTQIKSATDNIGTFDRNNPDIRYSLDTEQLEKTVRAIDTKALEEGLQSMTLTSNVNSFTMKDPSRFFDAISKNNTELRDELHDIFEKPHSEATGKYARGIKDMQERVRNIATEAGILSKDGKKFDKAASAAVQNYGEGYQLKKCTVEAKVVDADTVFINAVSDGINVLSGDFTLQEVRKNFGRENGDMIWEKAFDQAQKNSERGQKASAIEYESTTSPYKLTDLQTQFPRTWQKLVEADKAFREMYDEYIGNMNAMLREIYPNSFTKEDDTVAKIDDLVEKKKHRITDTEKAIAERMKSLGKVEAEMAAKKRTDTKAYDTLRRRQTALNEAIADLNEKKAGYNEDIAALAVKKNAIFELDKSGESLNRMHQLEYRQDYYHHFNEMSVGLKEAWNLILQGSNRDISPAVVGNTANSKAKTRWAGFFQQRKGGAYTADAVNGMLKYGALAEYKLAFDPLVAYLRDAEKKIRDVSDETNRNSLILYLNSWTNQIAGKSSDFDRLLTDRGVVGRNILNFLQKLNGRVIRNTLYFNARSAIVQISNISNAVSLVTNPKDWKNGVLCWSRAAKGDEMMQNIMSQSNFLASRFAGVEMMDTSTMAKAERFANWMLSIADTISAKATWWAAYNQYVRNPNSKSILSMPRKYESAVDYADDVTRRTHGGRGVGEKAPIMTSKLVSFFAPFQLEVNNTYQLLKENIKKKNALGIATMEATVFAMNAVFEAIVGSTILPFDFIRALIDILFGAKDILDDDDDDHKLASTFKLIGQRIGAETVSGLPYAGMIPQFLGEDTTEAVFGETDMTKYGNVNMGVGGAVGIGKVLASLAKWGAEGVKPDLFSMVNELSEVLPPIGGKQIARTIGGLTTVAQGYSGKTNSKGEDTVQFATDTNVLNYLHAGIFGKWALTEASEYFGEDRILPKLFGYYNGESASAGSPVKAEEFHAARALGLSGKGYFTIRKELKEYRTQEGKRSSLYTTNLTPAQKAGMDALLISTSGTSSETKSEGAIVYGRTKQEDGSWGEWKVKADYSSEDLFKLSLYGDTKYSAGTTAMKNGAGIKNVLGLLDTVDAYNDANENPMTATQKRDWLRENVKDTKQAALLDAYILSKNKSTNVKVEGNVVYTMSLGEDGKPSVTKDGTVAEWKVKADYTDDTWYAISRHGDSKYRKGLTAVRKGANPKTIRKYLDDMQAYQDSKNQSMSSEERGQWIRRNGGTPKEQAILDAYMLRKDSNTDAKVKDGIVYTMELGEDGKPKVYKSGSVAEWKVKADYTSDEWYAVFQTDHYDKAKIAYSACGIKPAVFVDFYTRWSDLSAKDASGKTVSGLKKKRTKELLDKMNISTEQKAYLYYKVCGYK